VPLVCVGRLSRFPPGSVTEVLVGENPYAICRLEGTVTALSGVCIHRGGPLGQGQLHGGRVVCPYHLWEFDCRTGEYDYDPAKRVSTYEITIEGEEVFLQVP